MANTKRSVDLGPSRRRPMCGAMPQLKTNGIYTLLSLPITTCTTISEHEEEIKVDTYIDSTVKDSSQKQEILANLTKVFHLGVKKESSTKKQPRESKKRISQLQRQLIGLCNINKKALRFRDFISLHNLWKEYMRSYLNMEFLKKHQFRGNHTDRQWKLISIKLLRADYQGAILKVIRSSCPSLVGLTGIMVYDTKNTYSLLGRDNNIRTIPKIGSAFLLKLDEYEFTIFGQDMCIRPLLRSVKKIKKSLFADI